MRVVETPTAAGVELFPDVSIAVTWYVYCVVGESPVSVNVVAGPYATSAPLRRTA